ncbi:hypothetical protein JB92DRAFT_1281497 [Gautieria morchelliformis]|nr:hypothetical protein JB92DRAFT_1281497 [Gautieria morchelliformis]
MSYQYNPYYSAPPSHPMPLPHAVPQAIPQPAGGLNMGHLRSLADHFDRAFAASQQVLLARISKQDALLSQQQESLSSISELLCNGQSESIKRHETLKAEVYDIGKKTDRITKGISESMKLLAAGTIKAITECQTTIERRLLCVEETCEGIKEEIRDPQANMDATVCREMAVGSDSPIRTVSYCDAATTPPSPPTPSFELPPQSPPCSASVRGRSLLRDPQANMDGPVCREFAIGSDLPIRTVSYCDAATTPPSPPTPSFELPPQSPPCSASVRGRALQQLRFT